MTSCRLVLCQRQQPGDEWNGSTKAAAREDILLAKRKTTSTLTGDFPNVGRTKGMEATPTSQRYDSWHGRLWNGFIAWNQLQRLALGHGCH